jgi:hypothetical protein
MARRTMEFTKEIWDGAKAALEALPPKEPKKVKISTEAGLEIYRDAILAAKAKNYSFEEIVAVFKEHKIAISVATFRQYWNDNLEGVKKAARKKSVKVGAKRAKPTEEATLPSNQRSGSAVQQAGQIV